MAETIARVDWQMGQTLLPQHFTAQEEALLANTGLRFRQLGLPLYGVGSLKWNEALLADGTLSIQTLSVVLPSGELFEVPGNAVLNTLNMNVTGASKVSVYLHVTGDRAPEDTAGPGLYGDDGDRLQRVVRLAELSPDQSSTAALQTLKLAEFEKDAEDFWALSEGYVPPLLQIGTTPFLAARLTELRLAIEQFHFKLQQSIAASYLGGGDLLNAKLALRGVYTIERLLANLEGELRCHPFVLWEALKAFYVDLCLYQNVTPEHLGSLYRHDQLGVCLSEVMGPLLEQIQVSRTKTPYVAFERQGGRFVINELPPVVRISREVYLLVQKPRVGQDVSLAGVRVASASRLAVVHQLSLAGIPMVRITQPPFQHQFGSDVEFYLLKEGEEWDQALREGTLAFFERQGLEGIQALLYWRTG